MYGGVITDNKIFSLTQDAANKNWSKPTGDELPVGINSEVKHSNVAGSILNKNYEYKGGGVYIYKGTFNMYDGEISENVSINGGGVYVVSGATFNLRGGKIRNNYASSRGADFGNGGGIYIFGGSNCTIKKEEDTDLIIEGNRVSKYGGAIYVNGSTVTIEGCNITSNYASSGGGLAQDGTKCSMTLVDCNVSGNYSKNNSSINVTNEGSGGGVYIGNGNTSNKNTLTIQNSIVEKNQSEASGGGIYTGTNTIINVPANNVASILNNIASINGGGINMLGGTFTVNGSMTLNGNTSTTGNGAGIHQGGGTFTVESNATINVGNQENPNKALDGNGGGIYCAGTFTIDGTANIAYNEALNGGGVCVQNGSVTLAAGKNSLITNNTATNYGGGLYVFNTGTTSQTATFNGGEFTNNTANAGGAVCADGKITLTLAADMHNNTAYNGGAIYMQNGVTMNFGKGLIRNNQAVKKKDIGTISAIGLTAENNYGGIGGGVFMSINSKLSFTEPKSFGIYNNKADNAAADLFANGSSTTITLPTTVGMSLNGYDVPGDLYWAEDYVNGEILGNGKTGIRYQDALKEMVDVEIVQFDNAPTKSLTTYSCLEIGYHLVLMNLICEGLEKGDDAGILISYEKSSVEKLYRRVLFTGTGSILSKEIALPEYTWKFAASDWNNSKYKISYDPESPVSSEEYTTMRLIYGTTGQTVTIKYTPLESGKSLTKFYNRVVNYMKPL